ncbi:MAG: threonine/serine dehydratase [Anaerolineae bacterium]|jgi:threonine dehydratase
MKSEKSQLTLSDVLAARRTIEPHIWKTPLMPSPELGRFAGCQVHLKLECWQMTGSFKVRGALNRMAALIDGAEEVTEVVTASAGNHGLGVAYAAKALSGPPATIFVPETASATKLALLSAFDCQVQRAGADYDASHASAEAYARSHDAFYLSAYDDRLVVAGQGTAALEIVRAMPGADLFLVPVGGGGLLAGTAVVARATNPAARIVGVQPEASPAAYLSFRDGHAHETYDAGPTICDGLAGGFGRVPFEIAADLVDQVIVVPEADVRRAVAWLLAREQLAVEASGAIAIAPLLNGQLQAAGRQVVALLTGRNIDAHLLNEIVAEQGIP